MMDSRLVATGGWLLVLAGAALAQGPLPLDVAVARALSNNPGLTAAALRVEEADARSAAAGAARLPRVDALENWQRGNAPLFAFASRLGARQLEPEDFLIGRLNEPPSVGYFRTALTVQQLLYSPATSSAVERARIGREQAAVDHEAARRDLTLAVTDAYATALASAAQRAAVAASREAAESDLARADARRDAGMATEADVLALRVTVADLRARQARAEGDEDVARARLNRLMGHPIDARFTLSEPAPPAVDLALADEASPASLATRPDLQQAGHQVALADAVYRAARAAFLPEVVAMGVVEFGGLSVDTRRSSWIAGAEMRINLFAGGADRARLREATSARARANAELQATRLAASESVRVAARRVQAARAEAEARREASTQAAEAERLVRERYEAGLATLADLLRASGATLDAEARAVHSRLDVVVSLVTLAHALGLPY